MKKKINLDDKQVKEVRHLLVKKPCVVGPDDPIDALLAAILEDFRTRHAYVADNDNRLLASVRMNSLVELLFPYVAMSDYSNDVIAHGLSVIGAKTVKDIANFDPFLVEESTSLGDVARILMKEKINELPVVDKEKHIIGQVNFYEILIYHFQERQGRRSQKKTVD